MGQSPGRVHVPDGFLSPPVAIASAALAAAGVGVSLARLSRTLPERRVPSVGLTAAFVFAAQMLNFPVAAGTSGHLIGATLATVLLGPAAAVVVMTSVLVLQCFLFADGGLTALGANVFNMALLAPAAAAFVRAIVRRLAGDGLRARLFGAALAAWGSTMAAAVACAGELATSGTVPWRLVLPAMAVVHALIGLGEAVITALVLASLARLAPERLGPVTDAAPGAGAGRAVGAFIVALGLALFVAPFASPWPDGLERVAARLGFEHRAGAAAAPLADYAVPGWPAGWTVAAAGAVGVVVACALAWLLAAALAPRSRGGGTAPRA